MTGIHAPAARGWRYNPYHGHWETDNPEEVAAMLAVVEKDRSECLYCKKYEGQMAPKHDTDYAYNGRAVSYNCRSRSRHYNPPTGTMVGNAHCTCDSCF